MEHAARQPGDAIELVAGLRRGEAGAFDDAYALYRSRLYGFLLRMSSDRQVSDDLLQETWIRLARSARKLRPDTNLRAWLFTVARNLFLSHRRWAAIDLERRETLGDAGMPGPPTPADVAAASEAARRLERAIAALPPAYREVVLLVGAESMSPTEAAAVLGASPTATRKRLSRARAILREELADE